MKRKIVFVFLLTLLAVGERLWFDMGPNVELVTVVVLLAAGYWGWRISLLIAALVMLLTDLIIGNTWIFLFTWSGFIVEALVASVVFGRFKKTGFLKLVLGTGLGVGSSWWFYLWTNFGVWLLDSWGMYSRDLFGLLTCYINGWPFLKMNLLGNMTFVPIGFGIMEAWALMKKKRECSRAFALGSLFR